MLNQADLRDIMFNSM